MTGQRFNVWFARIGSAIVTVGALMGSSVHLGLMARAHGVDPFWGPPLALDAMALVAGAVRRVRRADRLALALLAGPVVLSWWLQVSDHWQAHPGDLIGAAMAGAAPLAAWGVFELFLRAVDAVPEHAPEVHPGHAPEAAPEAAPGYAPVAPGDVTGAALAGTVAPVPSDVPERAQGSRPSAVRGTRSGTRPKPADLPTLVRKAERLANTLDLAPAQLSQRQLRTELGIGSRRAKEIHEHFARPHLAVIGRADR